MADIELQSFANLFKSGRYHANDNNAGYPYGINILDETGVVIDTLWFKTKESRSNAIANSNFNVVGCHA